MTKNQRITLMADWWPAACAAQNWNVSDRDKRLAVLSDAVGRELKSASDLNHLTDIDAVKSHLLALAKPADLDSQVAIQNMPRTRAIYRIEQIARDAGFSEHYICAISVDRFGTTDWRSLDLDLLTGRGKLRDTLNARATAKRAKARASTPPPADVPAAQMSDDPF